MHNGHSVDSIVVRNRYRGDKTANFDDRYLDVDLLISTVPLSDLIMMMSPEHEVKILNCATFIRYNSIISVDFALSEEPRYQMRWFRSYQSDTSFARVVINSRYPTKKSNDNKKGKQIKSIISADYFVPRHSYFYNKLDGDIISSTKHDLYSSGLVQSFDSFVDAKVRRVEVFSPGFNAGYEYYRSQIMEELKAYNNLQLAGHSGSCDPNGVRASVRSAIELSTRLVRAMKNGKIFAVSSRSKEFEKENRSFVTTQL
jgi:protoporphyrinogen oxidase